MQIEAQQFLKMAEKAGGIAIVDMEATGLKGDYNSLLCITIKPWHGKPKTFTAKKPGDDRALVAAARDELEKYDVWVSYYGKGFAIPMLRTRLCRHGYRNIKKRHHLDLYWTLKSALLMARRSQAHLLEWLDAPSKKMTLTPEVWNEVIRNPARAMRTLKQRCESDCAGLEALYDRTKNLIVEVTK
jgi:DNA polymerase elongation subunit (family B)